MMNRKRKGLLTKAAIKLAGRCFFVFGVAAILLWLLVSNPKSIALFYGYVSGYTGVIVFQVATNHDPPPWNYLNIAG